MQNHIDPSFLTTGTVGYTRHWDSSITPDASMGTQNQSGLQHRGNSGNPQGLWLKGPEGLPHVLERNVMILWPSERLGERIGVHLVLKAGPMTGGFVLSGCRREREDPNADYSSKARFNSLARNRLHTTKHADRHDLSGTEPHWGMIGTGFEYTGRWR